MYKLLEVIAHELRFQSSSACVFRGDEVPLPGGIAELGDRPLDWMRAAGKALSRLIYDIYFLRRTRRPEGFWHPQRRIGLIELQQDEGYVRLLKEANTGSGWLESGWQLLDREDVGRWRVTDGRITLLALEEQIVPAPGCRFAMGEWAAIRFPKHFPHTSPGYYMAVGDAGPPQTASGPIVRSYVNVRPSAAPDLLRRFTLIVNRQGVPALAKVLNHPGSFDRPDAMVLYIERGSFRNLSPELEEALIDSAFNLVDKVPGFAKAWMPGVAIAEEPTANGMARTSFGEHRSLLIAMGLARAYLESSGADVASDVISESARLDQISATLRAEGLDPDRLYLNPGSEDIYPGVRGG